MGRECSITEVIGLLKNILKYRCNVVQKYYVHGRNLIKYLNWRSDATLTTLKECFKTVTPTLFVSYKGPIKRTGYFPVILRFSNGSIKLHRYFSLTIPSKRRSQIDVLEQRVKQSDGEL